MEAIRPEDIKRLSSLDDAGIRGGIHSKRTYLMALHDGSLWIFKHTGTEERDEIFVYLLAQKMFRGIVPEVRPAYVPKIGWGSAMRKVSGIPAGRVDGLHGYMHGNEEMQADLVAMLVLDYLIGNPDRHSNNWFLMHNDRLAAIDNGWAGEETTLPLSTVFQPADLAGLVRDEALWPKMLKMMLVLINDLTGRGDEARALAEKIDINQKDAVAMVRLWEPKLQRLARFVQTEASKLQKERVYIKPGEQAPAGSQVEEGPRGGHYYESEPVFPGFKRPQEHHAGAALLDDEAVVLSGQQSDIFIMALEELADTSAVFALASVSDPRMSDGPTRAAMKAHVSNAIAARLGEDMALPPGLSAASYVSKMLSSWAASSSDDNDDSIAMQLAASELFDVRSTPYIEEHPRAEYFREHEIGQRHLMRAKMVAQAMYDETQEFFKEHDIQELVLFRGMRWLDGAEPSEVQDVAWRAPSADNRELMPGLRTAEIAMHANPLSSWSYMPEEAESFANYKPDVEGTDYEGAGAYDLNDSVFQHQAEVALKEEAEEADIDVDDPDVYDTWKDEYLADKGYYDVGQWAYSYMDMEPPEIEFAATRALMVSKVPVRKILATAMTGLGCLSEGEIVTLGGDNFPTQVYAGRTPEDTDMRMPNFRDIVVAERDYAESQTPEALEADRAKREFSKWADANLSDMMRQRVDAVNVAVYATREKTEPLDKKIKELRVKMHAEPTLIAYERVAASMRGLNEQRAAIINQATNEAEEPFRIRAAQAIEEAGFEVPEGWKPHGQPTA